MVFVCTANRFRSVMAEHILKKLLSGLPVPAGSAEDICSAGVLTDEVWEAFQKFLQSRGVAVRREEYYGVPVLPATLRCLAKRGCDVGAYTSRPFRADLAREAKLVIAMEQLHKEEIVKRYPFLEGRVITMRELCAGMELQVIEESYPEPLFDPDDPHYMAYDEAYTEQVYGEIYACLKAALPGLWALFLK